MLFCIDFLEALMGGSAGLRIDIGLLQFQIERLFLHLDGGHAIMQRLEASFRGLE